ncbi:MAG: hypothetical protein ACRDWE_02405 [Acidimicrobiales bacterium]
MSDPIIRESTLHGSRLDDQMADEAARLTGTEDATGLPQDGAEDVPGEPAPPSLGARPSPPDDVTEGPREREVREEIRRLLADASYPAMRNDLLRHIGPDERGPLQAHLRALPPDLVFSSSEEVASAFGGIVSED